MDTIILSLNELVIARPCDIEAWRLDVPPEASICIPARHVCKDNAEEYLLSILPEEESFMRLSCGTIRELAYRLKRKAGFKTSPSSYIAQKV
jgi:hypothetical protein